MGAFGTVWLPYETRCKTGRTSAKVRARSRVRIFCNERTRSIRVDLKLVFRCVLFYLGAWRTVWLRYETRCKTGRTSAKVRAQSRVGIFRNECTRSTPLAPKLMFWCVSYHWGHSGPFGCFTKIGAKRAELVRSCHEVVSEFFATNAPDPTHWTLN